MVAVQHFLPDRLFDSGSRIFPIRVQIGIGGHQRTDDVSVDPQVELLHEALFFFGHKFVPFGKLECFGDELLALLTASESRAAGCPAVSMAEAARRNPPVAGYPGECLDTAGWRLQWEIREQGNLISWFALQRAAGHAVAWPGDRRPQEQFSIAGSPFGRTSNWFQDRPKRKRDLKNAVGFPNAEGLSKSRHERIEVGFC